MDALAPWWPNATKGTSVVTDAGPTSAAELTTSRLKSHAVAVNNPHAGTTGSAAWNSDWEELLRKGQGGLSHCEGIQKWTWHQSIKVEAKTDA